MKKAFTYLFAVLFVLGIFSGTVKAQSYCTPTYSYGCGVGDMITSFDLNTISETFVCATPPYYDHTNISTDLTIGETYTLTVSAGYSSTYFRVWIDFNNNYTFEASESVSNGMCTSSGTQYTFNLTIPNTVSPTTTRMRIRSNYYADAADPCVSYTYGNAIDYSVTILPLSDVDAGVSEILSPTSLEDEAASIPVEVVIRNYGTLDMDTADVSYSVNGGTPATFAWTGLLASGGADTVILPNMTVPPGNNSICAWTTMVGDTIPQDDTTCIAFYGNPLWDAGVTAILAPGALELENTSISPQVTIENFGVNTLTSCDIAYTINSGAPVIYAWTGSLATGSTANVILPAFIVPGGFDTICAYTMLQLDGDATNDETCFNFYADPQFDFAAYSFLSPVPYCGPGLEDVTVQFINQGDTTYTFDMGYSYNGMPAIVETVTQTVYPGDTITYTFNTQVDMTTTLYDVLYSFSVWCDVLNDPLLNNDTIYADVMAMHIPEDPIAQGATVVYGNTAQLIAFSIDTVNWYEIDTVGAPVIATGNYFITPVLLDTTTYWVNASTGALEQGDITTTFANNNGSSGNMFDVTAYTDITIDSFYVNASGSTTFEVWYRPGTYVGFQSSNAGWTQLGTYYVTTMGSGVPSALPIGGLEIPAGETYGLYVTGSVNYTNGTGTNQIYENNDMKIECGVGGSYFAVTISPRVWNGTIFYTAGVMGCASSLVPVTAIVTDIPTQDAGIVGLSSPVDGVELSSTETVTVDVYNYGLEPIWNVSVSFSVNGGPLTTEIISDTIQPYATYTYTFTGTADLSTVQTHTIEVCTSHPLDIYPFNDCMSFPVICYPLSYCTSSAITPTYQQIVNVSLSNINNSSLPNSSAGFTDFTNLSPALLTPGVPYNISVSSDFYTGTSYVYASWVEVYIDWNHDGIYDETTDELVTSVASSSQNTITETFTVPMTANIGVHGMRVILNMLSDATSTVPCGTYNYGETEDYIVSVLPLIPQDGGVIGFVSPGAFAVENYPEPVEVTVRNYGSAVLTAFDVAYELNGGSPVITPWTGSLAPLSTTTIVLPDIIPAGATNTICAYTMVTGDSNTSNDELCHTFWATPQYEAGLTQIVHPESQDCGLGVEHLTIRILNYGDTINGNLLATYSVDGGAPVTEVVSTQILPGDSLDYAFAATIDFTVTTVNDTFDIVTFINLLGDPIPSNDSISASIMSMFTPDPPLVFHDTVPYGSTAILAAQANASLYWYSDPTGSSTGAPYLVAGDTFLTPILYDTTSWYVEASGAVFNDIQVGTSTTVYGGGTAGTLCNPFGQWYTSGQMQFLIKASELQALGFQGGEMNSVAIDATVTAGASLQNFSISIGTTSYTALSTSTWQTGLQQVFFSPSYTTVVGLNNYLFSSPFLWDGTSNVIIQFCFSNGTSNYTTNGAIYYNNPGFVCATGMYTDGTFTCGTPGSTTTYTQRPNFKFNVLQLGCPSATIPVTAVVTGVPAWDAGVTEILSPNSAIELTTEDVTVVIHNWGLNAIANFPVSYTINGGTPVTDILPFIMQSGDVVTYTFQIPADLTAFGTYDICAYTGVLNDGWAANDTTCKTVVNDPLLYCLSNAIYTGYEKITNVTLNNLNNSSPAVATDQYTDFTATVAPVLLTPGLTFPISITSDFPPTYTYQYSCWVEVYIDWNHDGIYDETTNELAFSHATTASNTVTGTITVPLTALTGTHGMRVVFDQSTTAGEVTPCGTYNYGETEDYLATVLPLIPHDAGVVAINNPVTNMLENLVTPVTVVIQNIGTDTIYTMDVHYTIDGGTPVTYAYTGPLAPTMQQTINLPNLSIPGGFYDICAYTELAGDSNILNDMTCHNLYGDPQYQAAILDITAPEGGCDLGWEDVTIVVYNIADTVPIGNMSVSYSANGATPVTEIITDTILTGDTIVYTFAQQLNMTVTVDTDFEIFAWVDLVGDPNHGDDTTDVTVISYLTPADPTPVNQTVWSGTSASLTVTPVLTNLNYFWYDTIGGALLNNGPVFNTPNLFDSTSYQVQASSATYGDVFLGTGTTVYGGGTSGTACNPYGNWYTSNASQFLITAPELQALGFTGGQINSLAINVIDAAGAPLQDFSISLGTTSLTSLTTTSWQSSGMQQVYYSASHTTFTGWNTHEFPTPYDWDGVSNVIVQFCFSNGTSNYTTNASYNVSSPGYTCGIGYYTDGTFTCGTPGSAYMYSVTSRPNFKLNVMIPGCSANYVEVFANVQYAPYDAAVWAVTSPVSGAFQSLVDVTGHVYNNGLNSISNIPISYDWNGTFQVTETIAGPLLPGDDILYTFNQQLNIDTLWGQHTVCVYTSLANDGYTLNDEACTTFTNFEGDGLTCATSFQYGWVNDPAVYGETTFGGDAEWWSVEAPGDVNNAYFTLCGSSFDTKLEVYTNCTGFYQWYNDDNYTACGSYGPSHIDVSLLSAGTYYVKVSGYSNYFGSYVLEIGGDMPCMEVVGTVGNVSCNGQANGSIDLTVTNILGTLPFSYSWSHGAATEDVFGLAAGTYTVTVSDAANCEVIESYVITEPSTLNLSVFGVDVTTLGGQDGAIDLIAFGGVSPYTYNWSNGATTEDLANIFAGYYTVTVTDANGCAALISLMINSPLPIPLPPVVTTNMHEINVPSNAIITLDGSPVAYGSILVVFRDSAGTMVPGGYGYWSGMASVVLAYGADGVNPGFAVGEGFTWKLFDAASLEYYSGTVTYNNSYPNLGLFAAGGTSGIYGAEFLSIYTQNIAMPLGWSIFSTFISPLAPDIQDLLATVVGNIIIVKSGTGLVYWPLYNLDNINNIIVGQGYQVKTSLACVADFVGYPIEPQITPLSLPNGWSILGYLRQSPMAIVPIFSNQGMVNAPFTPPGILIIAKDDGGSIYWPQYGLDNIGTMDPGEGYQIKLAVPAPQTHFTFTYPSNSQTSSAPSKASKVEPVKYTNKVNTGNNMTIGIPENVWNIVPQTGDEVGVFNVDGKLVGSAVYTGGHTAITVWGDDELTEKVDGAVENTPLTLRYFDAATSTEQVIEVQKWESGNGMYSVNAIAIVGKLTISKTSSYALYQNMPNPFNATTEIRFSIPEDAQVNISVYNVLGDRIAEIVSRSFEAGEHTVQFNANELPSGNYFYKMIANDFVSTKPMHIVK
ncbi:MAG: T9SS type A sorting domain-containing protein [Bacteroidales bacterium]|nr:T9SS type A sorting domain-containing protein [Bacteroidales bacterium]